MKSNYIPPFLQNANSNPQISKNEQSYVKSFHKSVLFHNIKTFGLLFAGCFVIIAFCIVGIPSIVGINNNDAMTAQSQSVVKFAKVNDAQQNIDSNDVTALAANANKKSTNMKKIEDSMTTINLDDSNTNDNVPNDLIQGDKAIEEFSIKTTCSANVRGEPEMNDNIIDTVKRGTEFQAVGENGEWYKIKWKGDGFAYINKTCVE